MTVKQIRTIIAAAALVAGVTIAEAHHGGAVEFDAGKTDGPFVGTVTRVALSYPHPQIYFDVKREDGTVVPWAVMLRPTPAILRKHGWTRESIKPGDTISVTMWPHRTVEHFGNAVRVAVNGTVLAESVTTLQ